MHDSDVRLTVKSVRFRFQKINRNRNRDLEKKNVLPFFILIFQLRAKMFVQVMADNADNTSPVWKYFEKRKNKG